MSNVKPVSSSIRVLQLLARENGSKTSAEIARALLLNPSTCFNILRTLVSEEALSFDDRSKSYSIGLSVVKIAERIISREGRLPHFRKPLSALAEMHNVTVSLWKRFSGNSNVMIWTTEGLADVHIRFRLGSHLPRYIGSVGRLVASCEETSEQELRKQFKTLRWANPPTFEQYLAQIESAKATGYAIDDGFFAAGITAVAVPVFDQTGGLFESIVASMFRDQYPLAGILEIVEEMKAIASSLQHGFAIGGSHTKDHKESPLA